MLKTNEKKLIEFFLECKPGPPRMRRGWKVDHKGEPFLLPGIGGITLNVKVGDSAFGLEGDHIEPGVSCTGNASNPMDFPNDSLQLYACIGNEAKVLSGEAKGAIGIVTGHHGGSEHILVDFDHASLENLSYEDKIRIRAKGQGLKLLDYPDIKLFNLDPELLNKLNIKETGNGELKIAVTTIIPAQCMGSGVGAVHVGAGDYDVMTSDPATVEKYGLDQMRFGDLVALMDHDNSYGRSFLQGAISIGIVVHSDCKLAGHGPGISTIMTCPVAKIKPFKNKKANIADILAIGSYNR